MWSLLMALACQDEPQVNQLYPDVSLVPEVLDFGQVVVDYPSTLPVLLTNTGQAKLTVSEITVVGEDASVFSVGEWPESLGIDETVEIPITFLPDNYLTYAASLSLKSDARDQEFSLITLAGSGVKAPTPDIDVAPPVVDFGMVGLLPSLLYFTVENVGDGTLHISDIQQERSGAFTVISDRSFSLEPGDSTNVMVNYQATSTEGDNGLVKILSDDPDEATAEVILLGNGGGDFDYPVAVIDGPSTTEPRQTVNISGINSYDPDGDPIAEYEWKLVPPEGSAATLTALNSASYLPTDIAGVYTVQLRVKSNEDVWSAPAILEIDAIPQELLHVELFWDGSGADLDLHVAQNNGGMFVLPDDCNYCNQTPSWGGTGTADDPTLDLDDRYGYGPENINVDVPAVDSYRIRAHYFVENGDGTVVATVKVYLYGVEEASFSRVLDYNQVWDVARISWSGDPGTTYVIEDSEPLYEPDHRSCYTP